LPEQLPVAWTPEFSQDEQKLAQWSAQRVNFSSAARSTRPVLEPGQKNPEEYVRGKTNDIYRHTNTWSESYPCSPLDAKQSAD